MKRLQCILLVIFIILPASAIKANVFLDAFGIYNGTGDTKNQLGFGGTVGVNIHRDFAIIGKVIFSEVIKNANLITEAEYMYNFYGGGLEYDFPINAYRLIWRSSILLGLSQSRINTKFGDTDDTGLGWALSTGIQYNATQHISPFLEFGYHSSSYDGDYKDAKIGGFQFMIGIRASLFNVRDIESDY